MICGEYLAHERAVSMHGVGGAPDWCGFETRTWELGELLRGYLKLRRDLRGKGPVLDSVASLSGRRELGKGRQSLVLLLGDYGGSAYAETLGALLSDPAVRGHVLKALVKAKIPGYRGAVEEIERSEQGWIRQAARKYLTTVG